MAKKTSKEDIYQSNTPSQIEERVRYMQLLKDKLDTSKPLEHPRFNALPDVPLLQEQLLEDIYPEIESLANQAIKKGNYDRLQALLGADIYSAHHAINQNIHKLHWKWIDAKTITDAYAKLFNILLWYAHLPILEKVINKILDDKVETLQNKLNGFIKNEDEQNKKLPLSNKDDCFEKSSNEKDISPDLLKDAQKEKERAYNHFKRYHDNSIEEGRILLESLKDVENFIRANCSQELFSSICENNAGAPIPALDTRNKKLLKSALESSLNTLSQQYTRTTQSTIFDFERNIKNVIIGHIQNKINLEIDRIFLTTDSLEQILDQFNQLWHQHAEETKRLEKDYYNLTNIDEWRKKQIMLEKTYRKLPEVEAFSHEEILGIKNLGTDILENQLGKALLLQSRASLLAFAIEECKRADLSKSEHAKRIANAVLLIRYGCSLFSLPEYSLSDNTTTKRPYLAWPLIIESLKSIACRTPTARAIQEACLEYAKEDHPINPIGLHRAESVMRLTQLLYKTQNSENPTDNRLLETMKNQIEQAPRGFLGRSSLYQKLEKIINKVENQSLLAIEDPIESNECSYVDGKAADKPKMIETKNPQRNTLFQTYLDESFKLVSLEQYQESLEKQRKVLEHFDNQLKQYYTKLINQPLSDFALIALKHRVDRLQFDLDMISNTSYDPDFWAALFLMPDLLGDDFSNGVSNEKILTEKNLGIFLYRNHPFNMLRRIQNSTIADSYTRFSSNEHKIIGPEAAPYIYLHQCDQRSKISIKSDIDHTDPHNLLGRVEWIILSKMIEEHQKTIHSIWNVSPNQLAYFDEDSNSKQGLWIINKCAVEPLMARMQLIAYFFNNNKKIKIPEKIQNSHSKAYLQLFRQKIIEPLYAETDRLANKENRNPMQDQVLIQCNALIASIEEILKITLYEHFRQIDKQTLTDDINAILILDNNESNEKIKNLKERIFNDKKLLRTLHHALFKLLREHEYEEKNKIIADLLKSIKAPYFEILNTKFINLMNEECNISKQELYKKIQKEEQKEKPNYILAENIKNLLKNVSKVEINKNNYAQLVDKFQTVENILSNSNTKEAGQQLRYYAPRLHGHASWKYKTLGIAVLSIGIAIAVLGLLFIMPPFSAFGISILATSSMVTFGLSGGLPLGACLFAYGRQKGFSNSTDELGKTLLEANPTIPQAHP